MDFLWQPFFVNNLEEVEQGYPQTTGMPSERANMVSPRLRRCAPYLGLTEWHLSEVLVESLTMDSPPGNIQNLKSNFYTMRRFLFVIFATMLLTGCFQHGENDAREAVDSFSVAYFNWRFADAMPFVTPQSTRWLRFAAAQVNQEDVDSLRAKRYAADVKVDGISSVDDTTKLATVIVRDFIAMDSIGRSPRAVPVDTFHIPVALTSGYWRVKLSRLP